MKNFFTFLLSFLIMGIIFWGCSDQQAPTAGTDNTVPVLMKPGVGGAFVDKYEVETYFGFVDDVAGLRLVVGVDLNALCNGVGEVDEFDFMDVWLPNADQDEVDRLVVKTRGQNVYAQLWNWPESPSLGDPDACDYYSVSEPIAIGTANVRNTDNDLWAFLHDRSNGNAFGWKANGTVWGPDGQRYKFNFVWRAVWDGEDENSYKEHYKIMLIPVGG